MTQLSKAPQMLVREDGNVSKGGREGSVQDKPLIPQTEGPSRHSAPSPRFRGKISFLGAETSAWRKTGGERYKKSSVTR